MIFRLFIIKDPEAEIRGFSLEGIKVPLTTFCPERAPTDLSGLGGKKVFLDAPFTEFWKIPTSLLISARPSLAKHLKGLDELWVPSDWCDVAPTNSPDQLKSIDCLKIK